MCRSASPAARPPRRHGSARRHPAPPAHSGPGPRRTSRHGWGCRAGPVARRTPVTPAIAISATATSSPPSDTSWQARTVAGEDLRADEIAVAPFGGKIDRRRRALLAAGDLAQPERLAEPAPGRRRPARRRATAGSAIPTAFAASSSTPRPPIAGVGRMARTAPRVARLVVEADIAGHDREIERLAGRRHAADRGGELAHDLRPLGVAEIHVVGERQRPGADRGQVAPGLGHRLACRPLPGRRRSSAACSRWSAPARATVLPASPPRRRRRRAASPSGRRPCCRTGPTPRRARRGRGRRPASSSAAVRPDADPPPSPD